jgi:hypothetical protein
MEMENVTRFLSKIDGKSSHWILENGITIDVAEKMLLEFLQYLALIKTQHQPSPQIATAVGENDKEA